MNSQMNKSDKGQFMAKLRILFSIIISLIIKSKLDQKKLLMHNQKEISKCDTKLKQPKRRETKNRTILLTVKLRSPLSFLNGSSFHKLLLVPKLLNFAEESNITCIPFDSICHLNPKPLKVVQLPIILVNK